MSLICCFRMERGKACPDKSALFKGGEREISKRKNRKELSTVAGRAGGPVRSSEEAPVMGVERRDRIIRGLFASSTGPCSGGAS